MPRTGAAPRPPKARGYPLIGNTLQILRRPWDFLQDGYRTLGPAYRVAVLGRNAVVLAGPGVRDLYTEAGDNFLDRSFFYDRFEAELESTELIFRTKGHRHRELRRCTSLAFSRHVAAEHVPAAAAELVRHFETLVPGRPYDGLELSGQALLVASGPMLGDCDLRPHLGKVHHYVSTLMEIAGRTRTPLASWAPAYRRAKRHSLWLGRELLEARRRGELGDGTGNHIISCFDDARDDSGRPLPDTEIVALAMLAFVGLGVYINRVVAFMLYELCRDDALRERVMAEVDRGFAHGFTYEALRDMELLRAVYCEALRRYPIWFLIPFRAEQDFHFAGKKIHNGEILLISSVQEHFLPEHYADPQRFDPERCLPPRNEHSRRGAFGPFGRGGRRCVAAGQTEIMSLLFTAVLLHRTHFRGDPGAPLRVRLKPLPAPHGFRLWFEGMREPARGPAPEPLPERSFGEALDDISSRLEWDETETFQTIVDREMEIRVFAAGAEVFHEGDRPDAFYVIESGEAVVLRRNGAGENERIATLGPGDVFGEVGLLRRQPRNATIAVAPGTERLVALECSADAFERLLGALNTVGEELIALITRRKVAASLGRLVPSVDRESMHGLVADAHFRRGRRGEVYVRERDPADAFYVIQRGTFEVLTEVRAGVEQILARLGEGDFFGEVGLLRGAPRNATVRVASDCEEAEALVLGKEAFLSLVEPGSPLRERVFQELGKRSEGP